MISNGSSPFVENPRNWKGHDTEAGHKHQMSKLEFQVSALETEKKLWDQERESIISKYEKVILSKNEELSKLQSNFDFLYEKNKQAESRAANEKQIWERKTQELENKLRKYATRDHEVLRRNSELEPKYNMIVKKYEQVRSDLNYQLKANDQLEEKIQHMANESKRMIRANDELLERMDQITNQLSSNSGSKLATSLQSKNISLQKTNNQLQLKVDQLLQNKFSVEIVRQKNISLVKKMAHLESIEEKACKLEVENMKLKTKFDDFFNIISSSVKYDENDSNESVVMKFISKFKQLQNQTLILQEKYDATLNELNQTKSEYLDLILKIESDIEPNIATLNNIIQEKTDQIEKLERQKQLNVREIEYLRQLLKELDELNQKQIKENTDTKATAEYLSNLEKLVDDYRNEINSLQKQVQTNSNVNENENRNIGDKRPRLIENDYKSAELRTQLKDLKNENLQLLSKVKELETSKEDLTNTIDNLNGLNNKKNELHILQLRTNPAAKDQIIKQQELDVLKRENNDLISTYIEKEGASDVVPKSVFERQEFDKQSLQEKIDQLSKRNKRLKEIYSQKSRDILTIISKYFGYVIEFLPSPINPNDISSRIKLISKYMNNGDKNNAYIIIDIDSKKLKAFGNYEFKTLCEDLVANWIDDKGQVPCLLSALNLKIYEKYVIGK